MDAYYVNNEAQSNGDHEVHKDGCSWMPKDREYLGRYGSCQPAVAEARKTYLQSNGCLWCCLECHTQ